MESNPEIGMVFGDSKRWYSWTGDPLDKYRDCYQHGLIKPNTVKLNTVIDPPSLLILQLSTDWCPSMSNNIFRKKVIEEVGGFEETFTGMHEDQVLWAKIALNTPVYVSESCWDLIRKHPDSFVAIATKAGQFRSAELFYLRWLEKFLSQNKNNNPNLKDVFRKKMWRYKHPHLAKLSRYKNKFKRQIIKLGNLLTGRLLA